MEINYDFSEIGRIGSLAGMSLEQIIQKVQTMHIETISKSPIKRVVFEDSNTKLILQFNRRGVFKLIELEVWKDLCIQIDHLKNESPTV